MRLAIGRISDGEIEYAQKICQFVRDLYRELIVIVPLMDDHVEMKKKMEVMLQSVIKIENGITVLEQMLNLLISSLVHILNLLISRLI
jgi:predicted translin family RNA/ssDNA-binding protein